MALRIWFGLRSGQRSGNLRVAQKTFLTSPVVMEQIFWQRRFTENHEDLSQIERLGYHAVIQALEELGTANKDERPEINTVRRFYRERHRRISYPTPSTDVIYRLFLAAFHAEYVFIQHAVTQHSISVQLAEQLQQRITFDEITYIQNSSEFMD